MRPDTPWIVFGHHLDQTGQELPVGLPLPDLQGHTAVVGTTGSGKSTLLRNLALQAFDLGATVVVIEPHGDLILDPQEGVLAALPHHVLDRVTLIDLNSPWPPQLNLTTAGLWAGRSVAVATAMRCIRVGEEAHWYGAVRMREILEHTLHLLLATHGTGASLVQVQRFLTDGIFCRHLLQESPPAVMESRDYWERLLELVQQQVKKGRGEELLEVPQRRVGSFLRDERLRHTLALPALWPPRELHLAQLLDRPEARLILVPLQATELGEEAKRVFGTLFMQLVTNTFLARARQAQAERRQTVVIMDEFADLAGGELGVLVKLLLAQARKFGASIVLATQALHQLPREVQAEVHSNTNIKVVLRVASWDDARIAAESLGSDQLNATDVQHIEAYHGYGRVLVQGAPQPPFYFQALPPLHLPASLIERFFMVPPPLDETTTLTRLQALHELAGHDPEAAIAQVVVLSDREFQALVETQAAAGEQISRILLAHPELEPNSVRRARQISQARYGLPWWFYEAQYRRIRFA